MDNPLYSSAGFDDFTLATTHDLTALTIYGKNTAGANPSLNMSVDLWISAGGTPLRQRRGAVVLERRLYGERLRRHVAESPR